MVATAKRKIVAPEAPAVPAPLTVPFGNALTVEPGETAPEGVVNADAPAGFVPVPVVAGVEPVCGMLVTGFVTLVPGIVTGVPVPFGMVVGGMVVTGLLGMIVVGVPGTVVVGTSGDVTDRAPLNVGRVTSVLALVVKVNESGLMLLPFGSEIPVVMSTV
jgi:hypothetical protein